jgi:hypothetical protein
MKLPRSSLERFESLARSLYGLRRGFRVGDINSVLKAFNGCPPKLRRVLKKPTRYADMRCLLGSRKRGSKTANHYVARFHHFNS